ncbi:D-alanyl-D-alanine carboxypeptidase / D-alanyl-D-alanine-endopeptidase (penicillin-binding protein 4) [Loktanella fryxellensis]|uniref:D-alanyl-D-alanine carboxypeptidase / D-alanyl-D-alanine-endopeptidase (Penicillin-binding protein 4) n=1 Tax=Loktanella fryxellensis TaxID=245187 RepID=A0A1H8AH02_9RHOB|nr:D-alanyl-D-alanine carboxypeptidase/D-alanyl-D-alanine-endopeptidase [Loktanella fryxellensis]SEM69891.1 D-alanyl-D-alanine carboxypeptidase / D-alanyl-D-alanine-endopeptidase (penicillin-binding protein 4) [Loktanella fryxellensis]
MTLLTRPRPPIRGLLSVMLACAVTGAQAAPQTTLRPVARAAVAQTAAPPIVAPVVTDAGTVRVPLAARVPADARPVARTTAVDMIRAAGLDGQVGFVIADADTGEVLERVDGSAPRPPASVTKALTALYGLETLGDDYRFVTRVLATGPVTGGVVQGDLILAGGGDPLLDTDDLAVLVQQMVDAGVTGATGDFQVWGAALPEEKEIEPGQLDQLGYNPSLGGLNLNFNTVYFSWARQGGDYAVTMDARSATRQPPVQTARVTVADRTGPVYTYAAGADVDEWSVARSALGEAGSRWLPVRFPDLYAADVFRTLAREAGVTLPAAAAIGVLPATTTELSRFESAPLREVVTDMMRYSTNLTAEVVGMTTTAERQDAALPMRASAADMEAWITARAGFAPVLFDHSGLDGNNAISAADMVALLDADGVQEVLVPVMRPVVMLDDQRQAIADFPADVRAKTGTLNFVSALAGYVATDSGRNLTFAFFAYDPEARAASRASLDEQPAGAAAFNGRAKRLQQDLLQRWAVLAGIAGQRQASATAVTVTR